jgi:hypothetical protein
MKLSTPTRENHEALWNWLAKNPTKEKWDWPGFATMQKLDLPHPHLSCFLCEDPIMGCSKGGSNCPLLSCMDSPGAYKRWNDAIDPIIRSRLAIIIANCFNIPVTRAAVDNVNT